MATGVLQRKAARYHKIILALLVSNALSFVLFAMRALSAQNFRYRFLIWNLVLAWVPLLLAYWLKQRLAKTSWRAPGNIAITLLWLGFLPNSFYLVSDLIHLVDTGEVSKLFDATLFVSFIFNAYTAGFLSIYMMHREILKRLPKRYTNAIIAAIFGACGFAIYLGRYMRWNTWDVLVSPAGVLFDVSERVINPADHPEAMLTTLTFFGLLTSMYAIIWQFVRTLKDEH